jgi:16S rRNA G527 N7-methylase RsmG
MKNEPTAYVWIADLKPEQVEAFKAFGRAQQVQRDIDWMRFDWYDARAVASIVEPVTVFLVFPYRNDAEVRALGLAAKEAFPEYAIHMYSPA